MSIALFDPSIASENLGDLVIREAVERELARLFPHEQVVGLPSQVRADARVRRIAGEARHRIVGGSNLLSSRMLSYRQWQIGLRDARRLGPALLMGVGWWQYQQPPDPYSRAVLRRVLARDGIHSVRDDYTREMLRSIGIDNVVNTGCPTMWGLDAAHCAGIPRAQAPAVVTTLTDYSRDPAADGSMLAALGRQYAQVHLWPQGTGDARYALEAGLAEGVTMLPASLAAFDALLAAGPIDFVGTRLHAGIRALQQGRRALVVAIDNRGREIARETGLPVIERSAIAALEERIAGEWTTELTLPFEAIARWRGQFAQG